MHVPVWVNLEDGALIACRIGDIGQHGARLDLPGDQAKAVPDAFMLWFSEKGFPRRFCKVVWRDELQLGVAFVRGEAAGAKKQKADPDATPLDC